jgi:hypothetical protein
MDDTRVFSPFIETGTVLFSDANSKRSLATTERLLPEGLCGGPVLDEDGKVCGIVEGVVPTNHSQELLAGTTCFLSAATIREFLDMAEKYMLEVIVPEKVFRMVEDMKAGDWMVGREENKEHERHAGKEEGPMLDETWQNMVSQLKENCTEREAEAVLATIRSETDEVLEILERDGGDVDEVIREVHARTMAARQHLMQHIEKNPEERQRILDEIEGPAKGKSSSIPPAEFEEKAVKS